MKREELNRFVKERVKRVDALLSIHQTVDEAIEQIRRSHISDHHIFYFYVVNEQNKLFGIVSTRDLLISSPDTPITFLLNKKIRFVKSDQTMEEALLLMQKFHLLALPVVENGYFKGVIDIQNYFEKSIALGTFKKRLQIFQTLGFILDEGKKQTVFEKYATRAPWMFCNMLGGLLCAVISDLYEMVLLKAIVLAMFIPLVLSLSESISMQSMAQSMHEMSRSNHFWKNLMVYLCYESKLFSLIAVTCGTVIGFVSLLWGDGLGAAMVIGSSITISVIVSAIIGVLIPFFLHKFKLDPKIASGPIVLMLVDTITTTIYLSLAFWWLF